MTIMQYVVHIAVVTLTKLGSVTCVCLKGFEPQVPQNWNSADWSDGCVRITLLDCNEDRFVMYSSLKFPDTQQSWFNQSKNLKDCETVCLKNCSCTAYKKNWNWLPFMV